MNEGDYIKARMLASILVMMPNPMSGFKMTARIADIEPERRRGYLRRLAALKSYQRLSRKNKTVVRRMLLAREVASV